MVVACCAFSTLAPLPVQSAVEGSGIPVEETDERESQKEKEKEEVETVDPLESRHRRFRISKVKLFEIEKVSSVVSAHRPTELAHVGHSLANGLTAPLIC